MWGQTAEKLRSNKDGRLSQRISELSSLRVEEELVNGAEDRGRRATMLRDASSSIFETKRAWFILSLLIQSSSDLGVEPKGSTNAP